MGPSMDMLMSLIDRSIECWKTYHSIISSMLSSLDAMSGLNIVFIGLEMALSVIYNTSGSETFNMTQIESKSIPSFVVHINLFLGKTPRYTYTDTEIISISSYSHQAALEALLNHATTSRIISECKATLSTLASIPIALTYNMGARL